ncbi:MAG: SDR family NAD(P)-dependent oxidoreductase [Clostridiales bacterium]|nr:SDR family NAD(P)-dependent oxidoreductase [Clostridiales bacterium]
MSKVVVITGGSSGIGLAATEAFAQAGWRVAEISRNGQDRAGVSHFTADISNESEVQASFAQILSAFGRVDVLINNAGFGISGAVEFTSAADAERQVRVNYLGLVHVTKAALPIQRAQGGGTILNVSSVAAAIPIPFQAHYSASKAAVTAFSRALALEVRPFGIRVAAVQPGDIKTNFTEARNSTYEGDETYNGRIARSVAKMEHDEQHGMPASVVAKRLLKLANKNRLAPVYTVGFSYQLIDLAARLLPRSLAAFIVKQMYAK